MTITAPTAAEIRAARIDNPDLRELDLAQKLGIREAQLVAAHTGPSITRIDPTPDRLIPLVQKLGEVMALTRNFACVNEKVGRYEEYRPGTDNAWVVGPDIDLRIFPRFWCYGFMVEKQTDKGLRRSIQIFNEAGIAVHKIHLRDTSDLRAWEHIRETLATGDTSDELKVDPMPAPQTARMDPARTDELRAAWDAMADTHEFSAMCDKLDVNRLGAYRLAGAERARRQPVAAIDRVLEAVRDRELEILFFSGNRGCLQIHAGPVKRLKEMGNWQNILDPGFDMHLRRDLLTEVWLLAKPLRGETVQVLEAYDDAGRLVFQMFPLARNGRDYRAQWVQMLTDLGLFETDVVA